MQSSADIKGNIIDGIIAVRDRALMRSDGNEGASLLGLFVPDLCPDLCSALRGPQPAAGAFENFSMCLRRKPSIEAVSTEA